MKDEIDRHCYIILNNDMVSDGIKYEIGKIYKIPEENEKCFLRIFFGIDELNESITFNNFNQDRKLFEIKILNFVSKRPVNFKIIRECNYKEVSKREPTLFRHNIDFNEVILAVKLNDEKILDKMLKLYLKDCRTSTYGKILIKSNINEYHKKLLDSNLLLIKRMFSLFTNRNKILDVLIKTEDREIAVNIIEKGINKYLDFYNKNYFNDDFILGKVLRQGRKKDIDSFLNSEMKEDCELNEQVVRTGIDKYLNYAIDYPMLYNSVIDVGRKKDLDHILKNKDDDFNYFIARQGFDEHLDIISKTSKDKENLEEVLKHERECDLWLKAKLERDE
jgi:hypothetical protein